MREQKALEVMEWRSVGASGVTGTAVLHSPAVRF